VLAAGSTFAVILLRELPSTLPEVVESGIRAMTPDSGLRLRVASDGDRLSVNWNRRDPLVLTATGGTLLIEDGAQRRDVHLDSGQMADGSVSYKPISNDVTFRLEINGKEGSDTASVRVLDGTMVTASKPPAGLGSRTR
jgi:hypothetical protein